MGGLWWFNDALTLGFTLFVAAAAIGAIAGRPFIVQRLTGIGIILPLIFIGLTSFVICGASGSPRRTTAARTRGPQGESLAVVGRGAGMWSRPHPGTRRVPADPKFAGAPAIRELRLVWVEASIGLAATVLLIGIVATTSFTIVGVVLALLLSWPLFIYGSAVSFAIGDPARAPLGDALREKARLEIAPRAGRVARSRPARAGAIFAGSIVLFLAIGLAAERDRPAILISHSQTCRQVPGSGRARRRHRRAKPTGRTSPTETPARPLPPVLVRSGPSRCLPVRASGARLARRPERLRQRRQRPRRRGRRLLPQLRQRHPRRPATDTARGGTDPCTFKPADAACFKRPDPARASHSASH